MVRAGCNFCMERRGAHCLLLPLAPVFFFLPLSLLALHGDPAGRGAKAPKLDPPLCMVLQPKIISVRTFISSYFTDDS
ncbi:hypothetical protein E2562_024868 [Oryza meyeriana var. granulata]|uniref:Uncharacterized protein n=1 Tax=Oryza meyeriana var. granulata TaxID=110450 RepID=A0A6G1CI68_9ORYZ|nr:hypothetical protein E2562_024868 [Oryza meyeriana var. granulata]